MQLEDEVAALNLPKPHFVHSLSASVSDRLWSRYVPAAQPAQRLVVAPVAASCTSYLVPGGQLSHRALPLVPATLRVGHVSQLCPPGAS